MIIRVVVRFILLHRCIGSLGIPDSRVGAVVVLFLLQDRRRKDRSPRGIYSYILRIGVDNFVRVIVAAVRARISRRVLNPFVVADIAMDHPIRVSFWLLDGLVNLLS